MILKIDSKNASKLFFLSSSMSRLTLRFKYVLQGKFMFLTKEEQMNVCIVCNMMKNIDKRTVLRYCMCKGGENEGYDYMLSWVGLSFKHIHFTLPDFPSLFRSFSLTSRNSEYLRLTVQLLVWVWQVMLIV